MLALVIAVGTPAGAQEARSTAAAGPEEIIVTAQKRSESIQDVPLSVSAVTAEMLNDRQITNPTELTQIVPGLTFRPSGNVRGEGFAIRGIGTSVFSDAVEQSAGTVIDGVPLARSGQATQDLIDIERVEVLRGPQGLLFGKNASAGVISITTRRPEFGNSLSGRISYATHNEVKGQIVGNVALGPNLAARLAFASTDADGIIRNIFTGRKINGRDSKALRGKLLWEPSEATSIYLIGDWARTDTLCCAWTMRAVGSTTTLAAINDAGGITPGPKNHEIAAEEPFFQKSETWGASLQIDHDFGGAVLSSVSALRRWHNEDNNDPDLLPVEYLIRNDGDSRVRQISQEIRLTSDAASPFEWLVGVYADRVTSETVNNQSGRFFFLAAPRFLGAIADIDVKNESAAIFGQLSYRPIEPLKISFGARYNWDGLYVDVTRSVAPGALADFVAGGFLGTMSNRTRNENFSWRGTLQYDFDPDIMAYATIARGYKGPGLNTLNNTPSGAAVIPPEIPTTYEAGLRSRIFGGTTIFNVSAFISNYRNFQAQIFDTSTTPASFRVGSAGKLETRGVEVEINSRLARDTRLIVSGAYIDSKFADFKNVNCYLGQTVLPFGTPRTSPRQCIQVSPTGPALTNADGLPLPGQSKWTLNADFRQSFHVGEHRIDAGVNWSWRSKVDYSTNDDPGTKQGAYGLLGANIGFGPEDDRWKISLFGRNLLKKHFVTVIFPSPVLAAAGDYAQFQTPEADRNIGVALDFKF